MPHLISRVQQGHLLAIHVQFIYSFILHCDPTPCSSFDSILLMNTAKAAYTVIQLHAAALIASYL